MIRFSVLACVLPFLAGVTVLHGATIYDNGPPDRRNGSEMTRWIEADDFTLGVGTRVQSVKFWSFEGSGGFQGSFHWQILANSGNNTPGQRLFSGTSTNLSHVATGFINFGFSEFVNTFDLPLICLPAGTYWLALHNGPLTSDTDRGVYWEATPNIGPISSHADIASFEGTWFSNFFPGYPPDFAFQLSGILGPRVTAFTRINGVPRISFTTTTGQTYQVDYKNSLTDASWTPLAGTATISGTGNVVHVSDPDPNARNLARRFYRARLADCPCNAVQGPRITGFDFDDVPRLRFTTTAGQTYRVEYTTNLTSVSWTPLTGAETIPGTGNVVQVSDPDPNVQNLPRRFYRAILL